MSDIATYTEIKIQSSKDKLREIILEEIESDTRPIIFNLTEFKGDLTTTIQEIINVVKEKRTFFHFPYPVFFVAEDVSKYNEDLILFKERHEIPLFYTLKNKTITKLHQSKIRNIKILHRIYELIPFVKIKTYIKEYALKQNEIHQLAVENEILNRILGFKNETKKTTSSRL
ncbi:MAG: hypothetical protein QE271_04130 [Bacteriovoracaceae bacterium]|nr:hypothetical protein [Bacteriovoracaceae bacterium]